MNRAQPKIFKSAAWTTLFLLALSGALAHAARPLNTDDAATLVTGSCQLETYLRPMRTSTTTEHSKIFDYGLAASCSFTSGTEWLIGVDRLGESGPTPASLLTAQVKKVFREVSPADWGWGIDAGYTHDASRLMSHGSGQNAYASLLFSTAPSAQLQFDFNLGALRELKAVPDARQTRSSWGMAAEVDVIPQWTIVAERTGLRGLPGISQIGLRTSAWSDQVTLDMAIGSQRLGNGHSRWLMFGLTWVVENVLRP